MSQSDYEKFGYLQFGETMVLVALCAYALCVAFAIAGQLLKDRRWIDAARNSLLSGSVALVGAAGGLVAGFVNEQYHIKYIYDYSEKSLPLNYKFAGLWAGLNGSLLFWATLVGIVTACVAIGYRKDQNIPAARRMEPSVYAVFAVVQIFFLLVVAFAANPFWSFWDAPGWDWESFQRQFPTGVDDGSGLNPLLVNYWMAIHPPTLYVGWVIFTVPFGFGVAALLVGEQSSYWTKKVRRWMMVGWLFNTSGIIMGGLWAYEVLGWGGYWAWDPVENASFLPWFAATAFLHSIMVQERRDMLKVWNSVLVILTFFLSIFGTYLTRSGIVSSVHAFANGSVGFYFECFLSALWILCLFLVAWRSGALRSKNRIESIASREAVFVINNLILLAIAMAIMVMTLFPFLSRVFDGTPITVGPSEFNKVINPFWVLLMFLTAIGPGLGWIKTSKHALKRNFLTASLLALPIAAAFQAVAIMVRGDEPGVAPVSLGDHIFTALVIYPSSLILTTVALEVLRASANRARRTRDNFFKAMAFLCVRNNRRYGGYLVHVGLGVLAIGVVCSSIYKIEKEAKLAVGDSIALGNYDIYVESIHEDPEHDVYGISSMELLLSKNGQPVVYMLPEIRFHKKQQQPVTEVAVYKPLLEDVYAFFQRVDRGKTDWKFFRNPLMKLIYIGWITMIVGGLWAAIPLGRRRVGLAD